MTQKRIPEKESERRTGLDSEETLRRQARLANRLPVRKFVSKLKTNQPTKKKKKAKQTIFFPEQAKLPYCGHVKPRWRPAFFGGAVSKLGWACASTQRPLPLWGTTPLSLSGHEALGGAALPPPHVTRTSHRFRDRPETPAGKNRDQTYGFSWNIKKRAPSFPGVLPRSPRGSLEPLLPISSPPRESLPDEEDKGKGLGLRVEVKAS